MRIVDLLSICKGMKMNPSSKFKPDDVARFKHAFLPNAESRVWIILEILNNGKVLLGRADKDYTWETSEDDLLQYAQEDIIAGHRIKKAGRLAVS
jgi:hypothetical protein